MSDAFKASMIGLWLQLEGPNTDVGFLGCHDLEDISEPGVSLTPVRCRTRDGKSFRTVQQLEAAPGNPSTTITSLMFPQRDLIEKLKKCPTGNLYILASDCGDRSQFNNFVRGQIMYRVRPTGRTYSGQQTRTDDVESTVARSIECDQLLDVDLLALAKITIAGEVNAFNDIWVDYPESCAGSCTTGKDAGEIQYIVADSAVGPAKGKVYVSINKGETWTATAADPGVAAKHLMGVKRFAMGRTAYRLLVCQEGEAATQGIIIYSDDGGTTWTTVNIGGAAAGHGIMKGTGVFMPRRDFGLIACRVGYIYKTIDGGQTWTAVESGVITVGNYNCIHFADDYYGVAGAAGDIIALSSDGGESWTVTTATGTGDAINCCWRLDRDHIWLGTSTGHLFYSNDAGVTWTERTGWVGSGIGAVKDIWFINDVQGFLLVNNAGPVGTLLQTIDGGKTWNTYTTPTNIGLNRLGVVAQDFVMCVGEPDVAPLGVIVKGVAAFVP